MTKQLLSTAHVSACETNSNLDLLLATEALSNIKWALIIHFTNLISSNRLHRSPFTFHNMTTEFYLGLKNSIVQSKSKSKYKVQQWPRPHLLSPGLFITNICKSYDTSCHVVNLVIDPDLCFVCADKCLPALYLAVYN